MSQSNYMPFANDYYSKYKNRLPTAFNLVSVFSKDDYN